MIPIVPEVAIKNAIKKWILLHVLHSNSVFLRIVVFLWGFLAPSVFSAVTLLFKRTAIVLLRAISQTVLPHRHCLLALGLLHLTVAATLHVVWAFPFLIFSCVDIYIISYISMCWHIYHFLYFYVLKYKSSLIFSCVDMYIISYIFMCWHMYLPSALLEFFSSCSHC